MFRWLMPLCGLLLGSHLLLAADASQLVVGIAPDWNSMHGQLWLCERKGDAWQVAQGPFDVLFGKNGLAWGRGVRGQEEKGLHKVEKDKRAPAGVFRIGTVYTYDAALPKGSDYPFHQVTAADAWIDNPALPNYNQHVVVDLKNPPPWYEKEKMRLNDPAYHWLVEIRANADQPVAGEGSAIFFHIRRGETKPTAGCTTMEQANLVRLITWLRRGENPHYVLLPRAEYAAKQQAWDLPPLKMLPGQ
ncbi:MAG: hypothetical protein QM796_19315 [Chthoniobacteraceae bacterium]